MKLLLSLILLTQVVSLFVSRQAPVDLNSNLSRLSESGVTERRQRIAVVDTGISPELINKPYMCKDTPVVYYGKSGLDWSGHGSNVAGLIGERINQDKYCLVMYSMSIDMSVSEEVRYLYDISYGNFVGVNISLSSANADYMEYAALQRLVSQQVKIFIAAGNEKNNLDETCNAFPACYAIGTPALIIVANRNKDGIYSNYGKIVDLHVDGVKKGQPEMTGSSQATAIATGEHFSK